MTQYRIPCGWTTRREPGQRPNLEGTWLDPRRADCVAVGSSYQYHTKIHWATPPWATEEMIAEIKAIYDSADPSREHVDHIVPLKHDLVCGLNVPWNLQVIPDIVNVQKSNNYWPDCPDHLCPVKNLPEDMFVNHEDEPYQLRIL